MSPDVSDNAALASAADLLKMLKERQEATGQRYCTALINPAGFSELASCAETHGLGLNAWEQLPNVYDNFAAPMAQRGPRLFTASLQAPPWPSICKSALRDQTASFLLHEPSPASVRSHLASKLKVVHPDGSKKLFRLQDGAVLSQLAPLLRADQVRALLGPVAAWLALDVCSRPVWMHANGAESPAAAPLRLKQHQVDELNARLQPARIIAQANEVDTTLLHGRSRCEQWQIIRNAMQRAGEHGLKTNEDIALFCVLSLQLPDTFDRKGPVAQALERSRREDISFGRAIDQVSIEEWRAWDGELDTVGAPL